MDDFSAGTLIYGLYGRPEDLDFLLRSSVILNGSIALLRFGRIHPSIVVWQFHSCFFFLCITGCSSFFCATFFLGLGLFLPTFIFSLNFLPVTYFMCTLVSCLRVCDGENVDDTKRYQCRISWKIYDFAWYFSIVFLPVFFASCGFTSKHACVMRFSFFHQMRV